MIIFKDAIPYLLVPSRGNPLRSHVFQNHEQNNRIHTTTNVPE